MLQDFHENYRILWDFHYFYEILQDFYGILLKSCKNAENPAKITGGKILQGTFENVTPVQDTVNSNTSRQ